MLPPNHRYLPCCLIIATVFACGGSAAEVDPDGDGSPGGCPISPAETPFQAVLDLSASYGGITGAANDVAILDDKTFIASARGITVVDHATGEISHRTMRDGLPAQKVYYLEVFDYRLFAATEYGVAISDDSGDSFCAMQMPTDRDNSRVFSITSKDDHVYALLGDDSGANTLAAGALEDLALGELRADAGVTNWSQLTHFGNQLYAIGSILETSVDGGQTFSAPMTANVGRWGDVMGAHAGALYVRAEREGQQFNWDLLRSDDGVSFEFIDFGGPVDFASTGDKFYMALGDGGPSQYTVAELHEDQVETVGTLKDASLEGTGDVPWRVAADGPHVAATYPSFPHGGKVLIYDSTRDTVLWNIPSVPIPESELWSVCGDTIVRRHGWNSIHVSRDGGQMGSIFATPLDGEPRYLACDDDGLIVLFDWDGLVISRDGGQNFAEEIPLVGYKNGLAIGATHIYTTTGSQLYRVARDGGGNVETIASYSPEEVEQWGGFHDVKIFGDKLYALRGRRIEVYNDEGVLIQTLGSPDWNWITDISVSGESVYITENEGLRISHDGGQTFTLSISANKVAFFDGRLYVTDYDDQLRTSSDQGQTFSEPSSPHKNGLPSANVNGFIVAADKLWVGTADGLAVRERDQ